MSTPPSSAASMLRLPPSPETGSMNLVNATMLPRHLSLRDEVDSPSNISRLRSVARYGSFHPQAIACSIPLTTNEENSSPQMPSVNAGRKQEHGQRGRGGTSVAAIAGPQGVALFRVSRPHTPLVVLSHASSTNNSAISALSFQPHTKDTLLLAAARGNGILVWDASGHSLSPLLGRLAMEPSLSSSDRITSISWKASSTQSLLASTNATTACLWDLRTSLRANSSRPSVRLGTNRKVGANGKVIDPLVQIAASSRNEVATLDATGTVHVFDVRMAGNIGGISSFSAYLYVGIGLEYLPSSNDDTRWITWGLDALQTDAIVKVWSDEAAPSSQKDDDADSYWHMDSSPTTSPKMTTSKSVASNKSLHVQYRQVAEISTPYLACARVCPAPFENNVVTVGIFQGKAGIGTTGWQAETWELTETYESSPVVGDYYGVEKIASFGVLNDSETASMVGTNAASLGSLRGAELALDSSQGYYQDRDKENGPDLLLCCLSDKGFVTAHTVFKAPSMSMDQEGGGLTDSQDSPRRERPLVYSDRSGVFPNDGKKGLDAASLLRVIIDSEQIEGADPDGAMYQGTSESPKATNLQYFGSIDIPRPDDGTSTQFDMDVSVSYGAPMPGEGANAMDVVEAASPPVVLLTDEDNAIEIGLQRQNITEQIDKDRVPCPRLCGASFSPGLGGIVCFNNGEVRKMWSWYEQSDPRRRANMTSGTGTSASLQHNNSVDSNVRDEGSGTEDSSLFSSKPKAPSRRQECPRTLQDLEDMTDHARFSQWRSDESSSGGESSIDDESDESLDGFASGDEGGDNMEARKRIYEKYFGVSEEESGSSPSRQGEDLNSPPRSPPRQKQAPLSEKSNDAADGAFIGPTSDLVPAVFITFDQDALVFSGQSEELARGWMLGQWYTVDDQEEVESLSPRAIAEREGGDNSSRGFGWGGDDRAMLPRPRSAEQELSLEKEIQMSPSRSDDLTRMHRVRSDPMLLQHVPGAQQVKSKYGVGSDDDPVHAGAYSKRPNRNESLVFLKKLVTHQRGDRQLQSLMSPPDSPLLPNKMPFGQRKRSTSTGAVPVAQTPSPTSVEVNENNLGTSTLVATPLGVYTLAEKRESPYRKRQREERVRDACAHNAEICIDVGQMEKANVWSLLSQMAENVVEDECDSFNGWGGAYGGALGHDLVSSFLDFYEAQGDVQMLATIVCVLGGGQRKRIAEGSSLLPASHQDRYDSYIRRYAEVLYGWRLMSIRAEVRKHLTQRFPDPSGDDQYATIDIVVWCSRCHKEAASGDVICQQCRNFALRCSLCEIAVRGLFTVCASCGHGGHTSHLTEWFGKHSVCPTGCGCECVLVTTAEGGDTYEGLNKPTQPVVDKVLQEAPELRIAGAGQIPPQNYNATGVVQSNLLIYE